MQLVLVLSLALYVVATGLGVLLRWAYVAPLGGFAFGNAVHAHSHTLYFGWAGLTLLALGFRAVGDEAPATRRLLLATFGLSVAAFFSFLGWGYKGPSIGVSSAFLVVWAFAFVRWWRAARGRTGLAFTWLRAGFVYLALASLGAIARVVIVFLKPADPLPGRLAVFAFLHCFAWFFLYATVGLLLHHAARLRVRLDERRLRWFVLVTAPIAWVTFPLGVVGGSEAGLLGIVARVGAAILAPAGLLLAGPLLDAGLNACGPLKSALLWIGAWATLKPLLELGGVFGLADLAVALRHPAIAYLHVLLVGIITAGLLVVSRSRMGHAWIALHNGGLVVMLAGLVLAAARGLGFPVPGDTTVPGLWLAAIGGTLVFAAGAITFVGALLEARSERGSAEASAQRA